ncbi:LysR substrate-binding domain-containing protein [Roseixanthobacter pseudopolyaromaticivorans]|uniref:LysR substrate-binding domain-containing protein n=1 Tax=Xanthobacteraceae TaxID=335928 RepID=UPI003727D1D4
MELRQLQHFIAVAEEGHFTRAAGRVNIVQSALSASIRALEGELGAQLFVRSTRQVRLTAAGSVLLDKARLILEAVGAARAAVVEVQSLQRGKLSVGTMQSLPPFLDLPALLARFHAQHPAIEIRLTQGGADHMLDCLREGRLDLAFFPLGEDAGDVVTRMIACEEMVLACGPGHPLAGRADVQPLELARVPFVDFERGWGTRRQVDQIFAQANIQRRIAFEVNELGTLLDLVAQGLGVALVPEAIARGHHPAVGIAHLAGPEICWELVVAHVGTPGQAHANPAAHAFLDLLGASGDGSAPCEPRPVPALATAS